MYIYSMLHTVLLAESAVVITLLTHCVFVVLIQTNGLFSFSRQLFDSVLKVPFHQSLTNQSVGLEMLCGLIKWNAFGWMLCMLLLAFCCLCVTSSFMMEYKITLRYCHS